MKKIPLTRTVCCIILLSVPAVFAGVKQKTNTGMRKNNLSLIKRGGFPMQLPIAAMAKKTVQSTGRYLSYIKVSDKNGGSWENMGTMRFMYDADGRIGSCDADGESSDYQVEYEYSAAGDVVVETYTEEGVSQVRTTTYFGSGTTYKSFFDHMMFIDFYSLDQPEVRVVDSMVTENFEWDATSKSWKTDFGQRLIMSYQSESFTVTTTHYNEDGSGFLSGVDKYVPAFTADGKVDTIVSSIQDVQDDDFLIFCVLRHTYDETGRLASIEKEVVDSDLASTEIYSFVYDNEGALAQFLITYDWGEGEEGLMKFVYHYTDAPNAGVTARHANADKRVITVRAAGSAVEISSPVNERILSVGMYDLSGREIMRFDAAANGGRGVRCCSIPLSVRSGVQLLRIRTERSVVTKTLQSGMLIR